MFNMHKQLRNVYSARNPGPEGKFALENIVTDPIKNQTDLTGNYKSNL